MTVTRRDVRQSQELRRELQQNQQTYVVMNSAEFLDYAQRVKAQQGLTQEQFVEWVDQTLDKAGLNSNFWQTHRDKIKNTIGTIPIGLDVAAFYALAADMKRGGRVFTKFRIKESRGVQYVIFKGYANLRKHLTASRYLASNPKVVSIGIGTRGVADVVRKGFIISIFISVGFHAVDQLLNDKKTWHDFVGGVAVDIGLAAVASGITWGAMATFTVGTAASFAVGPLLIAVAAGSLSAYLISKYIDSDALSEMLADELIALEMGLKHQINKIDRKVDDVKRQYNNDRQGFLYRMFGIPYSHFGKL